MGGNGIREKLRKLGQGVGEGFWILPGTQWPSTPPKHTVSLPLGITLFGHILIFTESSVLS